jgi:arylsulfatase A-like enzyme
VFVLLDNLGQEWLGCYGSEEGCTPNIDRLARTGLRVEHCYTPPLCGPSRIVALTGRYLLRSGIVLHHDAGIYNGGGLDPQREVTFARLLQQAGYRTVIAGKWQINHLYNEPQALVQHGFEESLVWPGSIDRDRVTAEQMQQFEQAVRAADVEFTSKFASNIESRYWDPVFLRNGVREVAEGRFGPDVLNEYVLDYLRRDHDRPFLVYYPMVLTHGTNYLEPVVPTPLNRDPDRSHHEMFADMVRYADRLIGRLLDELDRTGLRENTIVFVATDNGTARRQTARCRGRLIQGGLYMLTEAGSDVVLLVNSPRLVPGGRTMELADFSDLLPTFCELAGAKLPDDVVIDGRSFADVVLGKSARGPREAIFNQFGDTRVVRDSRYKLYSDGRLYDVSRDFDEQQDLSGSSDEAAVRAKRRLQSHFDALPPNAPRPFELRSQAAFKLRNQQRP